jgi:hypothetical protein
MDRRRFLLTSLTGAIAGPLAAEGQQRGSRGEGLADLLRHFQMHDRRYSRRSASYAGSPAPPAIGRGVKHLT